MKKLVLSTFTALCCITTQAQTTITKLIDSTAEWSRTYTYNNKLYLGTYFVGGTQYEMDVNTYALTPVAVFPPTTGNEYYESICQDFTVFNGKMSRVLHHLTPNANYLLAADNNSCDTILSGSTIQAIAESANKIFVSVDGYLYTTDYTTTNTVLVDSFSGQQMDMYAAADYFYYVKQDPANASVRYIIRTDGTNSTILETVNLSSTLIDFMGEAGNDFYYAVTLYNSNPTIDIKKVTGSGTPTAVTTQNVGSYPYGTYGSGTAVGLGKIFMILRSLTAPYPYDLWAYDLTANTMTQLTQAQTSGLQLSTNLNKKMFSSNALYFFSGGQSTNLWKTDGTVAGTTMYEDTVDIKFYNPQYNSFGLSHTAVMCDEYPIAGMDQEPGSATDVEYYYGDATGMHKYNINGANSSYPKDLVKVNNKIYFLATETANQFGKQSLYVVDGCGMPTAIREVNASNGNITVAPNPSNGNFTIKGVNTGATATLYNIQGQKVQTANTIIDNNINIVTNGLPTGIYMLAVKMNGQVIVEKVIIH